MQRHPLSAAFPDMQPSEFTDLVANIKEHGQQDPIILFEDMVLDGWHRFQACKTIGMPCNADEYEGTTPHAFVLARNLHRRHLTGSQRAAAIVAVNVWATSGSQKTDLAAEVKTNKELAEQADVSVRTIQKAKEAHKAGLGEQVRNGEMSAKAAVESLKPAKEEPPVPDPPCEMITITRDQYDDLHQMASESLAFEQALESTMDGDDKLAEAVATIKNLTGQISTLKSRLDGEVNKSAELVKMLKARDNRIAKLEKENNQLREESLPV